MSMRNGVTPKLTLTLTDTEGAVLTLMLGYRSLYIIWQQHYNCRILCELSLCILICILLQIVCFIYQITNFAISTSHFAHYSKNLIFKTFYLLKMDWILFIAIAYSMVGVSLTRFVSANKCRRLFALA